MRAYRRNIEQNRIHHLQFMAQYKNDRHIYQRKIFVILSMARCRGTRTLFEFYAFADYISAAAPIRTKTNERTKH